METIGFIQAGLARFAGPGHWNDPDMLEVGNGGMKHRRVSDPHEPVGNSCSSASRRERPAPTMTPETIALLTNKERHRDRPGSYGKAGRSISAIGPIEIWVRPLADGSKAVGIFNRHPGPMNASVDFKQLGFSRAVKARDIWQQKTLIA